jgi:ABC-type glycerol-3-phosphate transport system substrate-binding protein
MPAAAPGTAAPTTATAPSSTGGPPGDRVSAPSRTRRDYLRTGAGAVGAGLLTACGAAGGEPGESAPAGARRPVTVFIDNDWTRGDRLTVIQAWLQRANQIYPHITTDLRENANSQEKSIATFAADQQGDLVQLDPYLLPVFGSKGVLQDISPSLAAQKFDPSTVYDFPYLTHYAGKRLGLLIQLNANCLVYNASALQEIGAKEPAPSWTWDDFVALARSLHRPDLQRWGTNLGFLYPWFWSADVPYLNDAGTAAQWDSAAARPILQWHSDLVLRHRIAPSPREASELQLGFTKGSYAISLHEVPSPSITKAIDGKFEWNILPRPRHPRTGKAVSQMNGHSYLATAKARERGVLQESVQVLAELFHPDIQNLYLSGLQVSSLPVVKAIAESQRSLSDLPSNMKRYTMDAIATARTISDGKTIGLLAFHNVFNQEYNRALNGEVSLEQAAVNMTRAGTAELAQAAR